MCERESEREREKEREREQLTPKEHSLIQILELKRITSLSKQSSL